MHQCSERIGAIAVALAKAQAELVNPEKTLIAVIRSPFPPGERQDLPLCLACQRPRHRPQDLKPAGDRYHPADPDRTKHRTGTSHHPARSFLGRMDLFRLAGLRQQGHRGAAPDGGGAELCPPLCAVCPGRNCRRGRSRRARCHCRPRASKSAGTEAEAGQGRPQSPAGSRCPEVSRAPRATSERTQGLWH